MSFSPKTDSPGDEGLAVLVFLFSFMVVSFSQTAAWAFTSVHNNSDPEPLYEVYYDLGDPEKSVGIVGEKILSVGDVYRDLRVMNFEPNAIIYQSMRDDSGLKWPMESGQAISEKIRRDALRTYIAGQMKAIFDAQVLYYEKFAEGFAPTLEELIHQGFLADGFKDWKKFGYFFEIVETKNEFGKEPTFLAVASPDDEIQPNPFFSVDQLGLIRVSDTRSQVSWGPVWDYMDRSGGPSSKAIQIPEDEF